MHRRFQYRRCCLGYSTAVTQARADAEIAAGIGKITQVAAGMGKIMQYTQSQYREELVGPQGFEPWTHGLKVRRSTMLSYRPTTANKGMRGKGRNYNFRRNAMRFQGQFRGREALSGKAGAAPNAPSRPRNWRPRLGIRGGLIAASSAPKPCR